MGATWRGAADSAVSAIKKGLKIGTYVDPVADIYNGLGAAATAGKFAIGKNKAVGVGTSTSLLRGLNAAKFNVRNNMPGTGAGMMGMGAGAIGGGVYGGMSSDTSVMGGMAMGAGLGAAGGAGGYAGFMKGKRAWDKL